MKVAVVIAGHFREWKHCKPHLMRFLEGCNCEIYIDTYFETKNYHPYQRDRFNVHDNYYNLNYEELIKYVDLENVFFTAEHDNSAVQEVKEIEDNTIYWYQWPNYGPYDDLQVVRGKGISVRTYSQYRKIRRCFDAVKGEYDWIIKIRPDIDFNLIPFDLQTILTRLPKENDVIWICPNSMQPSDIIYIATPIAMNKLIEGMTKVRMANDREYNPHEFLGTSAKLKNLRFGHILEFSNLDVKRPN